MTRRAVEPGGAPDAETIVTDNWVTAGDHSDVMAVRTTAMLASASVPGPFEYHGAPDAERVIVFMGSGVETANAVVDALGAASRLGVAAVKLFRPLTAAAFVAALPSTVRLEPYRQLATPIANSPTHQITKSA